MPFSSFHKRLTIGFAAVVLCAAMIAASSIIALRSVRATSETLANRYSRELILAERLESATEAKVAAARALLLSRGDPLYRQRFQIARDEASASFAELRKQVASQPGQELLDRIERAGKDYQQDIDESLRMRESGASLDAVVEHWRSSATVHQEELQAAMRAFLTRKEMLLEEANTAAAAASGRLVRLIVGMTAIGLVLALTLAFLMSRTLVRMYNAEGAARTAAEEARQWFATTLASIGDAVIATDNHGKITFTNEVAVRLTGWHAADALGRSIQEVFAVVDEKTRAPVDNPVERVLQTGMAVTLANHTVLVGRDGLERPIDDSAAPIRDNVRGVVGVVLVFRDVSERRRAEAKVRETSQWLSTTLRSIGDAVIATNPEGRITLMNPVAQDLTGWNEHEAIGAPLDAVFRIISEQTRKPVESPVQKVLRTGSVVGLANHTVLVARDGTEWPLDDSGAPIRDADGNIIGVVLVFRQIIERRLAEDALRASEEKYRGLYDSLREGIIYVDLDGRIRDCNPALLEMLGYSKEEIAQLTYQQITPSKWHSTDTEKVSTQILARGYSDEWEKEFLRKDGTTVPVATRGFAIRDSQGGVVGRWSVVRDITEQQRAQEALVRSEKLASVGRLAATIAHEINNPLEAITNALFLVASDASLKPETRSYLETAEQELQRVAHLTKQTLGFYREASAPVEVAVQQVAENVLAMYEGKLRNKRIHVHTRYRQGDGHVAGNAGEIRQIISNLVANAIDALPHNGTLHLRVARCQLWNNPGTGLRVTVADTGSGIEMPHLGSIFEPFFTTKETVGTGLGLWVTREIVRKYGGSIRLRTRAGQGTVFCIYLPTVQAGRVASAKAS